MTSLVAKNLNNDSNNNTFKNYSNNKNLKNGFKINSGNVLTSPDYDNPVCVPLNVDTTDLKVGANPDGTQFLISTEFEIKNGFSPYAISLIITNPVLFYDIQKFIGRILFISLSIYEIVKYNPKSNEFLEINTRKKKDFSDKNPNLKYFSPRDTIVNEHKKGKGHSMGKCIYNTYMNEGEGAGYDNSFFKMDVDPTYNTKDIFGEDITIIGYIQKILDDTYGKDIFIFETKYNVGPNGEKKDSVVCNLHIHLNN